MFEPIRIHISGHTYSNCLPVHFDDDDVRAWVQAFDHVVRYVAPYGLSFVLFGRGYRVHFQDGVPAKRDVDRLCSRLRIYQLDKARPATAMPPPLLAA